VPVAILSICPALGFFFLGGEATLPLTASNAHRSLVNGFDKGGI
jgi:hypothetical protein